MCKVCQFDFDATKAEAFAGHRTGLFDTMKTWRMISRIVINSQVNRVFFGHGGIPSQMSPCLICTCRYFFLRRSNQPECQ